MTDVVYSKSSRPAVDRFVRDLPRLLSGQSADPHGVRQGMQSRVGHAIFAEVFLRIEQLSKGGTVDGERWKPLSEKYLAYSRPITGRQKPRAGKLAPGGNDGFLTPAQLKRWRKIFAVNLKRLAGKYPLGEAKSRAAAIAWKQLKDAGAKAKLDTFGQRKAGTDYQILKLSGNLLNSLKPGVVNEAAGGAAEYDGQPEDQVYQQEPSRITVGTRVPYAAAHHAAKKEANRRRLWPDDFPEQWWETVLDAVVSGLVRIGDLAAEGRL